MKVYELLQTMRANGLGHHAAMLEAQKPLEARLSEAERDAWMFRAGIKGVDDIDKDAVFPWMLDAYVVALNGFEQAHAEGRPSAKLYNEERRAWSQGLYILAGVRNAAERLRDDLAALKG